METLKKIVKIIFDIVIFFSIILVILVLYNFFQVSCLNKKYPEFFGYTFFEVTTGSMKNTIDVNDIIIVKITDDVKINDIISFVYNEEIITHRIVQETQEEFITKGDANNSVDKPVKKTNVIGKVVKTIPKLGIWIKVFTDLKVVISIIITIILFGLALNTKNEDKNKKNRHSFSKFIKNVKGIGANAKKEKETKD